MSRYECADEAAWPVTGSGQAAELLCASAICGATRGVTE